MDEEDPALTNESDPETDTDVNTSPETPLVQPSSSVPPTPSFKTNRKHQILASLIVTIGTFSFGTVLAWSSPGLPDLKKYEKEFGELTDEMESWIGSIVNLGALASGFLIGFLMDRIGRKLTLLFISVPFVVGWVTMALAFNYEMILAGRFITGFAGASFLSVPPTYVGEIVEPKIRGVLSSVVVLVLVAGILFTYIVGSFVTWIELSIICATIPILFVCCMVFIPESPLFLLRKGKTAQARAALKWLRGVPKNSESAEVEAELTQMQDSIAENSRQPNAWRDLLSAPILKPITICLMLMLFQQFGGVNAVVFYSKNIFLDAGTDIDPNLASILVGTTQLTMSAVSASLVERAGRKILLIISESGMAVCLIALAVFFQLKANNNDEVPPNLGWLPITSLILYMVTYNIAVGSVPWIMMGEILPPHVKGFASALASSCCWFLSFIVTKNFKAISEALGRFAVFCIFGVFSAFGALYAILVIPETKGKSLDEIQALFRRRV